MDIGRNTAVDNTSAPPTVPFVAKSKSPLTSIAVGVITSALFFIGVLAALVTLESLAREMSRASSHGSASPNGIVHAMLICGFAVSTLLAAIGTINRAPIARPAVCLLAGFVSAFMGMLTAGSVILGQPNGEWFTLSLVALIPASVCVYFNGKTVRRYFGEDEAVMPREEEIWISSRRAA